MANKLGLLQRLSAGVSRLLNAKELVGLDANGNKYYRQALPCFLPAKSFVSSIQLSSASSSPAMSSPLSDMQGHAMHVGHWVASVQGTCAWLTEAVAT